MTRVLLIGIDGGSPGWLERRMAAGELPHLARLREGGCLGQLRSTPNMMSPSAWTSMNTGVNPGKHGIFGFFDRVPGTYGFRPSDARARRAEPWWTIASRAGLRTAVLNVPCSWPADVVNGVQVAGWLAPTPRSAGFSHPPELADELAERFGTYPLHSDIQRLIAIGRHRAARDRIVSNLRRKAQIACWLLERERPDLAAVVFTDTDAAGHYFWHLTDPDHPEHDARMLSEIGDVVLAAWREIDEALPALLEAVEPDVVLVASDHGFGPNQRGHLFLPALLERLGWQKRRRSALRRLAHCAARLVPAGIKHRMAHHGGAPIASMLLGDVVWTDTQAFTLTHGGRSDICLNIADREPEGVVASGDAEAIAAELAQQLCTCTDSTGEPVIEAVLAREVVYHGSHVGFSPDLLVRWREDVGPVSGLVCAGIEITRAEADQLQTGGHRREGVLLAAGEGIRRGKLKGARVEDIAPTLLHLAGLSIPAYCDGRVVTEIFAREPKVTFDKSARLSGGESESDDIDPRVTRRLQGLGYL